MRVSIEAAAELVRAGRVVAYPTETVFGLGCDVRSTASLDALCALKGRSVERGFSVLVADLDRLVDWIGPISEVARSLAESFWPGPLTLVLSGGAEAFPLVATAHGVGFRCSPHPDAAQLARASGVPLASTSCNRTGQSPALTPEDVESIFGAALPVTGSAAGGGAPSTVVAVSEGGALQLLREGALPFDQVRAAVAAHACHTRGCHE